MTGSRYTGVGAVAIIVAVAVIAGDRGAMVMDGVVGRLAIGLFAAVAVFALYAWADRRDPALLLVRTTTARNSHTGGHELENYHCHRQNIKRVGLGQVVKPQNTFVG